MLIANLILLLIVVYILLKNHLLKNRHIVYGIIAIIAISIKLMSSSYPISEFEQFPIMGFFRYPMSKACPNKICITKGYVEITSGQHYAKIDGHTTWKWQGWNHPLINPQYYVQVHHFKWDKTCFDRIKAVADIKQTYSYSNEYATMFVSLMRSKFKIDVSNKEFMIEHSYGEPEFKRYKQWNKLIKKIISI
jgi:hypothetical protein